MKKASFSDSSIFGVLSSKGELSFCEGGARGRERNEFPGFGGKEDPGELRRLRKEVARLREEVKRLGGRSEPDCHRNTNVREKNEKRHRGGEYWEVAVRKKKEIKPRQSESTKRAKESKKSLGGSAKKSPKFKENSLLQDRLKSFLLDSKARRESVVTYNGSISDPNVVNKFVQSLEKLITQINPDFTMPPNESHTSKKGLKTIWKWIKSLALVKTRLEKIQQLVNASNFRELEMRIKVLIDELELTKIIIKIVKENLNIPVYASLFETLCALKVSKAQN